MSAPTREELQAADAAIGPDLVRPSLAMLQPAVADELTDGELRAGRRSGRRSAPWAAHGVWLLPNPSRLAS